MIKNTAIIGMGALGLLFGSRIAERLGTERVSFLLDSERLDRYRKRNIRVNGSPCGIRLVDGESADVADLVIVATKYTGLESALDTIKNSVGENTTIISVINGISSEEIIAARYGSERVLGAVAQGMDAVFLNDELRYINPGELRVGAFHVEQKPRLDELCAFLESAGLAFVVEEDIRRRMWGKFMLNVGLNQSCMVYETNYGGAASPGEAQDTMLAAMRETVLLANAEGIALGEADVEEYLALVVSLLPEGMPSMRQDGLMRRYSEVEMLAGTVLKLGKKHGIDTPVNRFLYDRIKAIEASYSFS